MCENNCATDGLSGIAFTSSPPSGRARSRLTRIALLRSQELNSAPSRRCSGVSDMLSPHLASGGHAPVLPVHQFLEGFRITFALDRDLRSGIVDLTEIVGRKFNCRRCDVLLQPVQFR